jgi:hypothetical protein
MASERRRGTIMPVHCPNCGAKCWRLEADELGREWVCAAGCAIRFKRMKTGKAWAELMQFLMELNQLEKIDSKLYYSR